MWNELSEVVGCSVFTLQIDREGQRDQTLAEVTGSLQTSTPFSGRFLPCHPSPPLTPRLPENGWTSSEQEPCFMSAGPN